MQKVHRLCCEKPNICKSQGQTLVLSSFHHPHCHHYHHLGNIYHLMAQVRLTAKLAHSLLDHIKFQGPQQLQYTCMHVHLKYGSETEELKISCYCFLTNFSLNVNSYMSPVSTMLHRAELEAGRKNLISSWLWIRSLFPKSTHWKVPSLTAGRIWTYLE